MDSLYSSNGTSQKTQIPTSPIVSTTGIDPVTALPVELIAYTLSFLPFSSLFDSIKVSNRWKVLFTDGAQFVHINKYKEMIQFTIGEIEKKIAKMSASKSPEQSNLSLQYRNEISKIVIELRSILTKESEIGLNLLTLQTFLESKKKEFLTLLLNLSFEDVEDLRTAFLKIQSSDFFNDIFIELYLFKILKQSSNVSFELNVFIKKLLERGDIQGAINGALRIQESNGYIFSIEQELSTISDFLIQNKKFEEAYSFAKEMPRPYLKIQAILRVARLFPSTGNDSSKRVECCKSVLSIMQSIPETIDYPIPELVKIFIQENVADDYLQSIKNPEIKFLFLFGYSLHYKSLHNVSVSDFYFKQALKVFNEIKDVDRISEQLCRELIERKKYDEAFAILDKIVDPKEKNTICLSLSHVFFEMGDYAQAIRIAKMTQDDIHRNDHLAFLANKFISSNCEKAFTFLEAIDVPSFRSPSLSEIIRIRLTTSNVITAEDIKVATRAANMEENIRNRCVHLLIISIILKQKGFLHEAQQIDELIPKEIEDIGTIHNIVFYRITSWNSQLKNLYR